MTHYLGQPSPGARLPLPVFAEPASIHGRCGCGKSADATYRRQFQEPQPICAACADRLGIIGVFELRRLADLPAEFRLEEAMRTLRWNGTGIQLARTLAEAGYERRRHGNGFVWYRRRAA